MINKETLETLCKQSGFLVREDGEIYSPWKEYCPINDELEEFAIAVIEECLTAIQSNTNLDEDTILKIKEVIATCFGEE